MTWDVCRKFALKCWGGKLLLAHDVWCGVWEINVGAADWWGGFACSCLCIPQGHVWVLVDIAGHGASAQYSLQRPSPQHAKASASPWSTTKCKQQKYSKFNVSSSIYLTQCCNVLFCNTEILNRGLRLNVGSLNERWHLNNRASLCHWWTNKCIIFRLFSSRTSVL